MQEYIKKILGSGNNATILIKSLKDIKDIMKIVKSLEDSGLLLKELVKKKIKIKQKNKKEDFLACY